MECIRRSAEQSGRVGVSLLGAEVYILTHIPLFWHVEAHLKGNSWETAEGDLSKMQINSSILDNAQSCLNWRSINILSRDVGCEEQQAAPRCVGPNFFLTQLPWLVCSGSPACSATEATLPFVSLPRFLMKLSCHVSCKLWADITGRASLFFCGSHQKTKANSRREESFPDSSESWVRLYEALC